MNRQVFWSQSKTNSAAWTQVVRFDKSGFASSLHRKRTHPVIVAPMPQMDEIRCDKNITKIIF